jgi:hypothetical protein
VRGFISLDHLRPTQSTNSNPTFESSGDVTVTTPPQTTSATAGVESSTQKVFALSLGPVAGATLIQTTYPTTTVARFVMADNGHVFDLTLDSSGAIPKAVSNTTIPGVLRALWANNGKNAVMQYFDSGIVKTLSMTFPNATTSSATLPVKIQFLPDGISDIAVSSDGKNLTYILQTSSGVDGYTSKVDGTGSKQLFSLPLSEILISWPSSNVILAQTKSSAGVSGAVFSIDATSGGVTPLLFALGLTATANENFDHVVYQTADSTSGTRTTFAHNIKNGSDTAVYFNPSPEECVWSRVSNTQLYCATPANAVSSDYLDQRHMGNTNVPEDIVALEVSLGGWSHKSYTGNCRRGSSI